VNPSRRARPLASLTVLFVSAALASGCGSRSRELQPGSYRAVLELPAGVYADGFEIMNGGTGTYDMRAENVEVRKLRFGTNDIFYDGFERGDTNVWSATAP